MTVDVTPYLIIGSTALQFHIEGWPTPPGLINKSINISPKDYDIIYPDDMSEPKFNLHAHVDKHSMPRHIFDQFIHDIGRIDLNSQYILKLSHLEFDIHWAKNISHLQLLKRLTNLNLDNMSENQLKLLNDLKEHWKIVHKDRKRNVSLNQYPKSFFNNKVKRKYYHDDLHSAMAYYDEPMYKRILKDNHPVLPDKKKWDLLSFDDKIKCAREEIYVIALERFLIPNEMKYCKHEAYRAALKKLITTMTKGWFPTFMLDNYNILIKIDKDYVRIFEEKLNG